MRTQTPRTSSGVGFFGLLTILFIGLKLTGHIDWAWWLVVSPLVIDFLVWFFLFVVAIVVIGRANREAEE